MDKLYICPKCKIVYRSDDMKECFNCRASYDKETPVEVLTHDMPEVNPDCVKIAWDIFDQQAEFDKDKRLKEDFFGFPAGTNRADVWQWFDSNFPGGVMRLMSIGPAEEINKSQRRQPSKASAEDVINKINDEYSPVFNRQGAMMFNGAMMDGYCSLSFTGDRFMIDKIVAAMMASSVGQLPMKVDPEKYLNNLARNALMIYQSRLRSE